MAKRTKNGLADPFMPRKPGGNRRGFRQSTVPVSYKKGEGWKDDAQTSKDLAAINREYQDKELSVLSVQGPHSIPDQHYEKSVKALPQPEEYKTDEENNGDK